MAMARKPLQLGRPTPIPASPDKARLDRVPNPHPGTNYVARFTAPEFTCLCPITGQPDFAHLVIDYVPGRFLVELKSLKLYLEQLPQSRRLPRGLHRRHRQETVRAAQAEISAHRRLLVSARRHADRRVLAGGQIAEGRLAAARPGRRALSRARLNRRKSSQSESKRIILPMCYRYLSMADCSLMILSVMPAAQKERMMALRGTSLCQRIIRIERERALQKYQSSLRLLRHP